jgi:hypothetical protein
MPTVVRMLRAALALQHLPVYLCGPRSLTGSVFEKWLREAFPSSVGLGFEGQNGGGEVFGRGRDSECAVGWWPRQETQNVPPTRRPAETLSGDYRATRDAFVLSASAVIGRAYADYYGHDATLAARANAQRARVLDVRMNDWFLAAHRG